eukprot:12392928-Prorocentrum_lima.AAC.1
MRCVWKHTTLCTGLHEAKVYPSKPAPSSPAQRTWTPKQGKGIAGQDPGTPTSREPQKPVPK